MKPAFVRRMRPQEAQQVAEWTAAQCFRSCADAEIFGYPSTAVLVAHNSDKPLVYMPVQTVAMLEAIAINPEASKLEVADSLKVLVQAVSFDCDRLGIGEIYMFSKDKEMMQFVRNNGFTQTGLPCFKRKVGR